MRVQCGCECERTKNVCLYARCGCERTADVCVRELEADAPNRCICVCAPLLHIREFGDEADGSVRIACGYGSIAGVVFVVHVPRNI